jgi:hypothetical protein
LAEDIYIEPILPTSAINQMAGRVMEKWLSQSDTSPFPFDSMFVSMGVGISRDLDCPEYGQACWKVAAIFATSRNH